MSGCTRWRILRPSGRLWLRCRLLPASWALTRRRRPVCSGRGCGVSRGGRLTGRGQRLRPRLSFALPVGLPHQIRRRADVHLSDPARLAFLRETAQPLLPVLRVLLPAQAPARPGLSPAVGPSFWAPELLVAAARMHGVAPAGWQQVARLHPVAFVVTEGRQQRQIEVAWRQHLCRRDASLHRPASGFQGRLIRRGWHAEQELRGTSRRQHQQSAAVTRAPFLSPGTQDTHTRSPRFILEAMVARRTRSSRSWLTSPNSARLALCGTSYHWPT